MWKDPIIEEIHKYREEYAKKFNYNIEAMMEDLRKRQDESERTIIRKNNTKQRPKQNEQE